MLGDTINGREGGRNDGKEGKVVGARTSTSL